MIESLGTDRDILDIVRNEAALMLYFYNDHCAPCISLRPKVEQLVRESFPDMKLTFINGETEAEAAAGFGVFSHPTLVIYFEGKEYIRESKYVSIGQLDRAIRRPYEMLFPDQSL